MTVIHRHHPDLFEEIEVPEGYCICPICKGVGYRSKYDRGWSSVVHDPRLAAKEACFMCSGIGWVEAAKCVECDAVYPGVNACCSECKIATTYENQAFYDSQKKEWQYPDASS